MKKLQSETTSDWLFSTLSEEIISGRLKSEEKLSEPEIARRFGTSRAPVREAIRRLEERGLVVRKPHSGPSIALFSMEGFLEVFEVREVLEGTACRLAAKRMTDSELINLRRTLEEYDRQALVTDDSGAPYSKQHTDFHYLIAQGSKNSALIRLLCDDYYNLIRLYRRRYRWTESQEMKEKAVKEHYLILEVLEERDGEYAEVIMRRHIASARKRWEKAYQKQSEREIEMPMAGGGKG